MPPTKRGIYHNLRESKYTVSNSEIVFFFSSELYRDKFLQGYKDNRERFNERLNRLISDTPLNMDTLADVVFYENVEKRGFLASIKGVEISCDDLHLYALRKMTDKNTKDWFEIPKPKLGGRRRIMGLI